MNQSALPARIGRYQPLSVLGRGSQGVVYLAEDPKLHRRVAIKTLHGRATDGRRLQQEARLVSALEHPSIVPLYDFGEQGGNPYLVFQYVEGTPLRSLYGTPMEPSRAIELISQVLEAIGHAHDKGVLHRDLTPANIMIDGGGRPLILDFGIASIIDRDNTSGDLAGTPSYMAPEVSSRKPLGPFSDLFSLGVIFHELISGQRLFDARNPMAVIYKINHEPAPPPSARNRAIDEDLDRIVLRALERDPTRRYQEARAMKAALDRYLGPAPQEAHPGSGKGALDFLLRRIRRRPDFPALSQHVAEINRLTSRQEETDAHELSQTILKDYALTNKLLRLVNSASFGHFGGEISTISRAVIVLGFEQVKMASLSIMLFEHLSSASHQATLKDAACNAFFSGLLARQFSAGLQGMDPEQAFIAAMFHELGRHLCICYFPEEFSEIGRLMANRGLDEPEAAQEVLGVGYHELGRAIAREWQFPAGLVESMKPPPRGHQKPAQSHEARLAQVSAFSNELTRIISEQGMDKGSAAIEALLQDYGDCIPCDRKRLDRQMDQALQEIGDYAKALNLDLKSSKVYRHLRGEEETVTDGGSAAGTTVRQSREEPSLTEAQSMEADREMILGNISEITSALVGEFRINEIVDMVLETIYRGMGFDRVLFCLRDPRTQTVAARFGLGEEIERVVASFRFALRESDDLFSDAVRRHKDYVVLDTAHAEYRERIPAWCRELTAPRSLVILPIVVNQRAIGLLYADSADSNARMTAEFLRFFATLRNQVTLAFKQTSAR